MHRLAFTTIRDLLWAPPRGLSAVEFGLAAPILILLLVAVTDLGLGFYDALQVQGAASAGAQYASIHAWNTSSISTAVQSASGLGSKISASPTQVCACANGNVLNVLGAAENQTTTSLGDCNNYSSCSPIGLYASVPAQYSYTPMLPYPWTSGAVTLTGQAYRRLQ